MQFPDEIQGQSCVLKKFALLIEFPCCVSRHGACGGLWTGQILLVCSIYVSVICMYCVMFDLRRKSPKSPKRPKRDSSVSSQKNLDIMDDLKKLRTLPWCLQLPITMLYRYKLRSIQ